MKASKADEQIELTSECDFRGIARYEIVACCYYEYLRESANMRHSFVRRQHTQDFRISPAADGKVKISLEDDERLHWQTVIHPESGLAFPKGTNQQARSALGFAL